MRPAFAALFLKILELAPGAPDHAVAVSSAAVLHEGRGRGRRGLERMGATPVAAAGGSGHGRRSSLMKPVRRLTSTLVN